MNSKNIYIDGIFDLLHAGHLESLYSAKNYYNNSKLIVGVISDKVATDYKRKPIFNESDRYTIISNLKVVDQTIFDPPLIIDHNFIRKYDIDIVLHAFSDINDFNKQKDLFKDCIKDNKLIFDRIPYSQKNSTSSIISNIEKYKLEKSNSN